MPAIEIQFNADPVIKLMQEYPARVQRATVRALNRTLTSGKALLASRIAKDMGLKVGVAKAAIKTDKATVSRMDIRLRASLRRLPLYEFGAKGSLPSRGQGRGVTYKVGTGGRSRAEHAFLARMPSGHVGVFARRSTKRLPIKELYGPSIGHVFDNYRDEGITKMRESFDTNLAHELAFASSGGSNA